MITRHEASGREHDARSAEAQVEHLSVALPAVLAVNHGRTQPDRPACMDTKVSGLEPHAPAR